MISWLPIGIIDHQKSENRGPVTVGSTLWSSGKTQKSYNLGVIFKQERNILTLFR